MDQDLVTRFGALEKADLKTLMAFLWPDAAAETADAAPADTEAAADTDVTPAQHRNS
jgi:hypothetical protein